MSTVNVSFTLDTLAPTILVTAPPPGLVTDQNPSITGTVTDASAGVASFQAALDGGAFAPITLGAGGAFNFATALALNGTADGTHVEHLKATDNAGNVSTVNVSFTLDTLAPPVDFHLDPASDTPPVGDGRTQDTTVTLTGTTEPSIQVTLEETSATTTSDSSGAFSFTGVALTAGDNTFTVKAVDQAGNIGTAQHVITLDSAFGTQLVEGTRFVTPLEQTIVVPAAPSHLEFSFQNLDFDTRANFIKDAFEASLTDAAGNPLVLPIATSRDAFLNITEGQSPVLSTNVQMTGNTVDVDLSHVPAGTQAVLHVRLVNNDSDTTTSVQVGSAQIISGGLNTPVAVTPAAATASATGVDFTHLADVTSSMTATYGETSLDEQAGALFASVSVQNTGTYPVDGPVVAVITNLSDPSIHVRGSDGQTPGGLPYFVLGGSLAPGQSTTPRTLSFSDSKGIQFTYDLDILGRLNTPPVFTSQPNTEAIIGKSYVYQATATDADNDALTFSLASGPVGMSVNPATGRVAWSPQFADLGNQSVVLQVNDGHGGTAQQSFTLAAITAPPNRPPLFTSTPIVQGNVDANYVYQAAATDPDGDTVTFALAAAPTGMTVDPHTGIVSWTPNGAQLGVTNVTLTAADGQGGTATQTYAINVLDDPHNHSPLITSDPVTQFNVPNGNNPANGAVTPGSINLSLDNGQTSTQTVSLSGLTGGPLTLGTTVNGILGTSGQQNAYTFSLSGNTLAYFDALTNNVGFLWSLTGPTGTIVSNRAFTATDGRSIGTDPVLSLVPGSYTLTISSTRDVFGQYFSNSGQDTGAYAFRLSDLSTATPITAGPVSGTLAPATTDIYRLSANSGDSYSFISPPGATSLSYWRMIDPYGNVIAGNFLSANLGPVTLTATGTYTVLVEGFISDTASAPYTFTAQFLGNTPPTAPSGTALTLGNVVSGALTTAGQQDHYLFNLATNANLYFDSLTNNHSMVWSLSGPAGVAVTNRSFDGSDANSGPDDPVVALPAGSYVLTVSGLAGGTGAYSFRLFDLASATALTPGTPVSGTLSPTNSTSAYQFTASAGQSFYFARLASSGGSPSDLWTLVDPLGNVVFRTQLGNDQGRVTLKLAGTYTLLVEGYIADTVAASYSLNVEPINDLAQSLNLGSLSNGNLATSGEQDRYTFALTNPALVYFDALTNNGNLQWSLSGAGGVIVNNRPFTGTDGRSIPGNPVISLPAGAYTLTISGVGQTSGAYSFRFSDLSTAPTLTPGTPVNDTLTPASATNLYQFSASAGESFYFARLSVSGGNGDWRLIDPSGNIVFTSLLGSDVGRLTLAATGRYTLLVEGFLGDTGSIGYSLNVAPITDSTQTLNLGSLVNGNLAGPGELDHYTFNVAASTIVYFHGSPNNAGAQWSLTGPTSTSVTNRPFTARGVSNPVTVLPAGTYTLTISGAGQTTGPYTFRMSSLAAVTTLVPGTPVSGSLSPANSTNLYQFNVTAGQSFYFARLSGTGSNAAWKLIDPFGNMLFDTGVGNDVGRTTLTATGRYTLIIEGASTDTGTTSYAFNVAPITDTTSSLALGSTVNATMAAPGEQDHYTFMLPSRALAYFDSLTNNAGFQWSLTGPGGAAVSNRGFTSTDGFFVPTPVMSLPAGSYTLTVTSSGQTAGAYAFRLSDLLVSATSIVPGTAISGTLNPANSTDLYQFSASAGQSFYFAHVSGGGGNGDWKLIDPYGNTLFNVGMSTDGGRVTLRATGTYTLLVEGAIGDTGSTPYGVNLEPITDAQQTLMLGTAATGNLSPGQQDHYTFTLAASALLDFDALTNNSGLQWSMSGPIGNAVNNQSFMGSDGHFANPVFALPAGSYAITVSGAGQTSGAYSFRLSDLTTGKTLAPNTPLADTLSPANSTNLYQFTATAGDQYNFIRQAATGAPNASWRLLDPYGNLLFNSTFTSNNGPITLPATGSYYLLVEGNIGDTGSASYTIEAQFLGNTPPTAPTGTALTLGSTVSSTIATAGQQDRYVFNLASNAKLYFDSLTNNGNLQWSLTGPGGAAVTNRPFTGSDGAFGGINPVLSLPAGTYVLTVSSAGSTTGAYSFRLSDLVSAAAMSPGTPINDTLSAVASTKFYQFNASAGQSFYLAHLSNSGGSFSDDYRLVDPYGNTIVNPLIGSDGGRVTLNATGTYTLLVEGYIGDSTATTYSLNVAPIADTTQTLSLGSLVNGNLAGPGQLDHYTFNLAGNANLYFDALTNNGGLQWTLTGPNGTPVSNRAFTSTDGRFLAVSPVASLPAGAYTLTVSGSGQTAGAYSFRLSNLTTATAITPGTAVSGTLSPGNSTTLYQFSGSAGQSFYFAHLSGGGSTNDDWRLVDPYGEILFNSMLASDGGRVNLSATGTYTLLIEGGISDTSPVDYSFNAIPISDTTQALTLGSTVSATLTAPSQQDQYTFNLSANTLVYFDSLTNNGSMQWSLSGPPGVVVSNRLFNNSDGRFTSFDPVLSLPAGVYTLTVNGAGGTAGAYSFRLVDLSTATPVTPGTSFSGTLSPAVSTSLYQFSASAGQSFYFARLASSGSTNDGWRLVDPLGNVVFDSPLNTDPGRITLALAGTYTILVEGQIADTSASSYLLNVEPITDTTQTLALGSTVSTALSAPAAQDNYTFTLTAPTLAYFDSLTNNGNYQWSLTGPEGTVVSKRAFNVSDSTGGPANPVLELPAGQYTLTVLSVGQTATPYSFRLLDLSTAPSAAFNTPVTGKITNGVGTDIHQFSASAGQAYYFESTLFPFQLVSNSNADWRLVDPNGNILFNSTLGTDAGRLTLPISGTYTLLVEGAITNTDAFGYEFKVDHPEVEIVASDPGVPFVNQTGVTDLSNATFNVQLQGNGQAQAFNIQFIAPATGIQLGAIPVAIDTQYRYQVRAADPDGDTLSFGLTQAPTGMQIDSTTGLITWSPTAAQLGANAVSVRVADTHGGFDVQEFTVNVINSAPSQIQGTVFSDANGDGSRTFTSSDPAPAGGPFMAVGAPFPAIGDDTAPAIIITYGPGGTATITYTGQGPYDGEDDTYVAVVNSKDSGVAVQSIRLSSDDPIFAFDADGIEAVGPEGSGTKTIGKTGYEGPGTYYTDFQSLTAGTANFDDGTGAGLQPGQQTYFSLEDVPTDIVSSIVKQLQPTTIEPSLAGWTVYVDTNHNGRFDSGEPSSMTDALGHYSFANLAPGNYTVAEVGQQSWLQTAPLSGTFNVSVAAGQTVDSIDFGNEQLSSAPLRTPAFTSMAPKSAVDGQRYDYIAAVNNPDSVPLSFDLTVKPDGMVVDPQTGTIVWYPTADELGPQDVILRMRDSRGDVVLQHVTVNVSLEAPPVITSTAPEPAVSGLPYRYQVLAQDAEGEPLTYSLVQAPSGMTIDSTTGLVSWTGAPIGPGLPGGYDVTIQVSDGRSGVDSQSFTLLVVAAQANQAPVIHSTAPTTVGLGHGYWYAVKASDPDGDPLSYLLATAPAGMTIDASGMVRWTPNPDQFGPNAVTVRVQDGRGGVTDQPFTVNVVSQPVNQPPSITSDPLMAATLGHQYAYDALGVDPDGSPLVWSLDSAPRGTSIDPLQGTIRWSPTADQLGSQDVTLRVTNGNGKSATQTYTITVRAIDVPPLINSTPPTQGAAGQTYTYAVQATDVDGDPLTYSLSTAPAGMTIDPDSGLIHWAPTIPQIGTQNVAVLVDDGQGGTATQSWNVVVASAPINHPPAITSTPPLAAGAVYQYPVQATDPDGQSVTFSLSAAPTGMTIDPASGLIQWLPTTAQLGTNPVTVVATDPQGLSAVQTFAVVVVANHPPTIDSTPPTSILVGETYRYDVHASDVDGDSLKYALTTAPTGMSIDPLGRISWSPSITDIGSAAVTLSVSDGRGGTVSRSFTITVSAETEAPQVSVQVSTNPAAVGTPVTVIVSATDSVGIASLSLTENGVAVALDSHGEATITPNSAGNITLVATALNVGGISATDSQILTVIDPNVTGAPTVGITTPADDAIVTSPTAVIGTVQDPNLVSYTLSIAPAGSDMFTTIATGTSQVSDGVLGTLDPTMLQNGSYDLRLSAVNTGGLISSVDTTVDIEGKLKLGNFTLSFTDLSIPVGGISIAVTRTYDTLNAANSGDFGDGWTLDYRNVNLQSSVGSTGDEADGFFNAFKYGTHVYVTLPGGQREGFTFQPKVGDGMRGNFLGIFDPVFVPDPGVTDSLTVDASDLRIAGDGTVYDYSTGEAYNPASPLFGGTYLVTTKDGIAYNIDGVSGQLTQVTDNNGNTLTFSDSGIVSTNGTKVTFERDTQNRVAAIIDPMGNRISYQYDATGNLTAVTDRSGNTTHFIYRTTPAHYLDQVIDPLGRTGVRTDYDDQGRLVQLTDANGNPVKLAYDPSHLVESVTDQFGNVTTEEFDDRGNILTKSDALGNVTRQTFDANNNMLTQTDPLGNTTTFSYDARGNVLTQTDPLGNATVSTYQDFTFGITAVAAVRGQAAPPFSRVLTSTDALGNTTSYNYNFFGNPESTTDPQGHTASITLDGSGNPTSFTNADGNTIQAAFDGAGNAVLAVDALGNATSMTFDANGDQLSSTTMRTDSAGNVHVVTTSTTYDAQGRPIAITDAAGGVTQTEYDADGNKTTTIDPLGNRTQYLYDSDNRLIETIYPDNTPSDPNDNPRTQTQYDAAGRIIAQIDQLGQKTQYQYDADGRSLKTIYPDGTFTATTYDADGHMISQVDQRGNVTSTTYDADGNVISTTDAQGNATTTVFNAGLQETSSKDALGNVTTYIHDANGRLIETDSPDGTKTTNTLDAAGRVISRTDQLGRTTSFEYDADGRVIQGTDPLGNETTYTYDEMGHQITKSTTQTAADGSVRTLITRTDYDDLGRAIAVTDPNGDVTRTEYDANGNITATIDPLGRRMEYVYDDQNRLIQTIYPDSTPANEADNPRAEIEYDAAGQNSATIDELGRRTTYQYDSQGRLVATTYPDGSTTQTEYNAQGYIGAQVDALGNRSEYQYDAIGSVTQVRDSLGNVTSYTYDADGRRISKTDPLGNVTNYVYDVMGHLIETDYPDGTKTTTTYDAAGQVIATTDQLGRTTHDTYDADGRLIEVIDPLGGKTDYAYDEEGDLIRQTDADGHVTIYEYDTAGRRIATLLPALAGQSSFESATQYDVDGNVTSTTDFNGNTIHFVYDARNRLVDKEYPDGTSVADTYTLTGKQATVTDARGTTSYTYDGRDRMLSAAQPDGTSISYTYDAAGDLTSETTPAGTTTYTFDALGRQLTVTDLSGGVTHYAYDADGNLTRTIMPNGLIETRGYDSSNRLVSLQDANAAGVISGYTYVLGPTGLRDEVIEKTGRSDTYTYDALNRLTREAIVDAVLGDRTIDYTYDAVGNRLSMNDSTLGITDYTYDVMDRLATATAAGKVTNYSYDKNGNLLSQINATEKIFYQYDFDNHLISADTNGDGIADETNKYDAAGNLVSQTVGGQEKRFLIDTSQRYPQVALEYLPSGLITASYVYGNSLISQLRSGVQSFYLVDGLGSTRALTNAAGIVTDQYVYDAFGRILFQTGSTVNPYLFAGQRTDPTTGLTYMRARFYDPTVGRFTTADPLRGLITAANHLQVYGYAGANPVNFIDPTGQDFMGLSDVTLAQGAMGFIAGAIDGYDSGGFKGAFVGAFVGLFAGLTLGVAGQGLTSFGVGAGLTVGASLQASSTAFRVTCLAAGTYSAITADSDQQKYASFIAVLFSVFDPFEALGITGSKSFSFSGGADESENALGKFMANHLQKNMTKRDFPQNPWTSSYDFNDGTGQSATVIDFGQSARLGPMEQMTSIAQISKPGSVKVLILSAEALQSQPNLLNTYETYGARSRTPTFGRVVILTPEGNGFTVVDDFVQQYGLPVDQFPPRNPPPNEPPVDPFGNTSPPGVDPFGNTGSGG